MRSLVLTLLCVAVAARADAQPPSVPPVEDVVVTSGEHVVRAAPDVATVLVVAESRAKQPREAQAANARTMAAVQEKLRAAGIPEAALRTRSVELQPEFDYANARQTLRGYVARNALDVRVDAIERVGEIVDAAVAAGATRVDGLRYDVRRRAELEREALKQAVGDARARADALAAGADRRIDRIVRIDDASAPPPPEPGPVMMRAEAAAAPTPVAPGELEIRARVTAAFKLKTQ